jgi:hypothetical protein
MDTPPKKSEPATTQPAPAFQQPAGEVRMNVEQIENRPFGAFHEGKVYDFNPTAQEIQQAIDSGQLEARGLQSHRDELDREWWERAKGDLDKIAKQQRAFNARRIAYLAVHGWPDPLRVERNGKMHDGTHRLRAAIHRELKDVAVEYAE